MPSKRGFASMTPEQRRAIARKGGLSAQAQGKAHRWTSEEAAIAGKKGGDKVSQNVEHMERIGKKGGLSRGANRKREADERFDQFASEFIPRPTE